MEKVIEKYGWKKITNHWYMKEVNGEYMQIATRSYPKNDGYLHISKGVRENSRCIFEGFINTEREFTFLLNLLKL